MRIGIDNVSTGLGTNSRTVGGLRHFMNDLVTWLVKTAPHHEYVLFQPDWADPLDLDDNNVVKVRYCKGVPKNRPGRVFYEQVIYPQVIHQAKVKVFLGTCNVLPLRLCIPTVVVMHSLQYFDYPRTYEGPQLAYLRFFVPLTWRKANVIIALSEASKQTIIEKGRCPQERIHVVYHGLFSDIQSNQNGVNYQKGLALVNQLIHGKPYILSVSSFYWMKNLPRLIEAFARLKQERGIPHVLLMVGGETSIITRRELMELATHLEVADSVIFPGVVPHALIPAFYVNAAVMAMPSLYETFGHPVLEAMSCGCPVVTSQGGTMAEIAQGCAMLVDPYNVESIAEGVARVLGDAGLCEMMVTKGRVRAQAFTLEAQARGYVKALEEAAYV